MEVALAAVKLAHEASGAAAIEEEIPDVAPRRARDSGGAGGSGGPRRGGDRRGRTPAAGMTRLFIGAGRASGIRPQDLVGAFAGETQLSGRDIGAIEIADRFSLVEVPEASADEVIAIMRNASIKGKRTTVRRERDEVR